MVWPREDERKYVCLAMLLMAMVAMEIESMEVQPSGALVYKYSQKFVFYQVISVLFRAVVEVVIQPVVAIAPCVVVDYKVQVAFDGVASLD